LVGQLSIPPQLSEMVVLQRPAQVVRVQQVSLLWQVCPAAHVAPPS
jgi:hypothetical protein